MKFDRTLDLGGGPQTLIVDPPVGYTCNSSPWSASGVQVRSPVKGLEKVKQFADIVYRFWPQKRLNLKISHNLPRFPICHCWFIRYLLWLRCYQRKSVKVLCFSC